MKPISHRQRYAQARARVRLDVAFRLAEQRMLKVIADETTEMVFGFMMNAAADLPPEMVEKVRMILRAFRADREHCTRKIVEIRRRQLQVLLQDEPFFHGAITRFTRWSKN